MSWKTEHFILKSKVAERKIMRAFKFLNVISCKTDFRTLIELLKL